jgi:hypothetical protein
MGMAEQYQKQYGTPSPDAPHNMSLYDLTNSVAQDFYKNLDQEQKAN